MRAVLLTVRQDVAADSVVLLRESDDGDELLDQVDDIWRPPLPS